MHGFFNRGIQVPRGRFTAAGRFGRLFPELRTLRDWSPGAAELGKLGGPMDGGNPPPNDTRQNNPRIKAGYTFLGQFIDHDLTLDTTSVLQQQIDVEGTRNFRTPSLELDSLYGLGPNAQPSLYDGSRTNRGLFLLSPDGHDLPRNSQGTAIIGDPRNDENVLVSQLHLLFLKFHNKVFKDHTDPALGFGARFEAAQKLVRWHYQWIVVQEFLPRICGNTNVKRMLREPQDWFAQGPFMPVEFSIAAYRFGHSQVRPGYALGAGRGAALFPDDPSAPPSAGDLRGGRPVPENLRVDWAFFFGPDAQPGKLVDTKLSTVLIRLPDGVVPPETPDQERSLAIRNLKRGDDAQLPSGQDVAARLAIPALSDRKLWSGVPRGKGGAPLWYYCLKEGEVRTKGLRLAGVGAELVGRTILGLLIADHASFMYQHPRWVPTLPSKKAGRFTMSDLTNLALGTTIDSEDVTRLPGDESEDD